MSISCRNALCTGCGTNRPISRRIGYPGPFSANNQIRMAVTAPFKVRLARASRQSLTALPSRLYPMPRTAFLKLVARNSLSLTERATLRRMSKMPTSIFERFVLALESCRRTSACVPGESSKWNLTPAAAQRIQYSNPHTRVVIHSNDQCYQRLACAQEDS